MLLSSNWIHSIKGVGQEFQGGAFDFRKCLAKFS